MAAVPLAGRTTRRAKSAGTRRSGRRVRKARRTPPIAGRWRPPRTLEPASATRVGVVLVDDLLRDPAPVGDRLALALRPGADGLVLLAICGRASPDPSRRPATHNHTSAADPPARRDEVRESVTQLRGVLLGQVNLVLHAVESELHRLVGLATIKVVLQDDDFASSHLTNPLRTIPISGNDSSFGGYRVNGSRKNSRQFPVTTTYGYSKGTSSDCRCCRDTPGAGGPAYSRNGSGCPG